MRKSIFISHEGIDKADIQRLKLIAKHLGVRVDLTRKSKAALVADCHKAFSARQARYGK